MFVAPLRRWFSVTLFLSVLAALVGVSTPALAATARTLTVSASPTVAAVGGVSTFTGTLSHSPQGSPVQVQRLVSGKWVVVRNGATSNAAGAYKAIAPVPKTLGTYSYRVFAPAGGGLASATSRIVKITALRATKATIAATPRTVPAGQKVTLKGTVKPFVRGGVVNVQRLSGKTWTTISKPRLTSTGTWSLGVKPSVTSKFRASVPRTGQNAPAISGATTVTVIPAPRITTTSLPAAAQAFPYSEKISKTGGGTLGTWSISKGFLPFGMSLNASTGVISGTPTAIETANFEIRYADRATKLSDTQALTIKVVASVPPSITTTTLPGATKGSAYAAQLSKTGATGTWSVSAGALPNGISLNASTGALSGTPTKGGTSNFTVKFTETGSGLADTQALSIQVTANPPQITTTTLADGKQGTAYAVALAKTGGAGTWSLASGSLPSGINLSGAGVLSGTPTAAGDFAFTVRFTESDADALSDTQLLNLHINAPTAPTITTTSLAAGKVGDVYSADLEANPNVGTWDITSGTLPNGLNLNASTGGISGTPTVAGDFGFTVRFTDSGTTLTASKPLSIHIDPVSPTGPTITTTSIPAASQGVGYTTQLMKTGGAGTWQRVSGDNFPAGITINGSTGVISGTPTEAGDFVFTVRFTETTGGLFDEQQLTLHVAAANPPVITTTTVPNGQQFAAYATTLTKTPGIPGATGTWTVSSGALPSGVGLNPGTGQLSGTPTVSGDFAFEVTYTETASGLSDTQALSLHVNPATPPTVTTTSLANGVKSTNYSATLTKTAGTPGGAGVWSISQGTLPAGLTLNTATGAITGQPTVRGDSFFTVRYTENASGLFGEKALSIHVSNTATTVITTSSLAAGKVGVAYNQQLTGTGNSGTTAGWELIEDTHLPTGLTLNPLTGVISGTPTVAGSYTFKVRMTRYLLVVPGANDERTFTIVIAP